MDQWKESGIIHIADSVISLIASIAALDTEGVSSMSGGIAEGIADRVRGKHFQKGVHVTVMNDVASFDMRIIVNYGTKIDHVCKEVQWNVKEAVETMTGLTVQVINVRVDGVRYSKEEETGVPEPNHFSPTY